MNNTSRSPKAFIAWIIIGVIGGLSLLIGFSFLLAIRLRRRNDSRNEAFNETLDFELQSPAKASKAREEMKRKEQERESRWQKLVSRFGNSGITVDDVEAQARPAKVKPASSNPTERLPAQLRPAKKLPRPSTQSIWPEQGQADVAQRVFKHVEYSLRENTRAQPDASQHTKAPPTNKQAAWPTYNQGAGNSPQLPDDVVLQVHTHSKPTEVLPPVSPERQAKLSAQRARIFEHHDPSAIFSRYPTTGNIRRKLSVGTVALRNADKH